MSDARRDHSTPVQETLVFLSKSPCPRLDHADTLRNVCAPLAFRSSQDPKWPLDGDTPRRRSPPAHDLLGRMIAITKTAHGKPASSVGGCHFRCAGARGEPHPAVSARGQAMWGSTAICPNPSTPWRLGDGLICCPTLVMTH